jgi:hypothetical protein
MSQIQNLWPTDFGEVKQKTPVSILREQGRALAERTENIVVGRVESGAGQGGDQFKHYFYLYCPPLGYQIGLLYVEHGIDLYPASIFEITDRGPQELIRVDTPEQFTVRLKEMFAQDKVKRIIASLIAQSKE